MERKEKDIFDKIINGYSDIYDTVYTEDEGAIKHCKVNTSVRNGLDITNWLSVFLDGKTYYIITQMDYFDILDIIERIRREINDPQPKLIRK